MTLTAKEKYNEELAKIVDSKKAEWADNIKSLSPLIRSKDPHDMTDAQAMALSYRTMLLEEINYFLAELIGEQKIMKELKRDKFILYTTGLLPDGNKPQGNVARHPIIGHAKVSGAQKEMIISGDLADFEQTSDILQNTIDYLRECIKTIDQYMYAIKNRLELFVIFK